MYMYVYVYVCICICICICMYMYVYVCICMYMYVCTCVMCAFTAIGDGTKSLRNSHNLRNNSEVTFGQSDFTYTYTVFIIFLLASWIFKTSLFFPDFLYKYYP